MSEKHETVLEAIKSLTREHGRVSFSAEAIAERSGIAKWELWDFELCAGYIGILQDLVEEGSIIVDDDDVLNTQFCLDIDCHY